VLERSPLKTKSEILKERTSPAKFLEGGKFSRAIPYLILPFNKICQGMIGMKDHNQL
jgi:hypothetical protein